MEAYCVLHDVKWTSENGEKRVLYTCEVTKASVKKPGTEISVFFGEHLPGRFSNDVIAIWFNNTTVHFFPRGLHKFFPNLKALVIDKCGLKEISREDLIGLENLEILSLKNNKIHSLPSNLLVGMNKIEEFSLQNNKLKFLSSKLLEPIIENGLKVVNFKGNTSIDAMFHPEEEESDASLQELMNFIDNNCKPPKDETREKFARMFTKGFKELWDSKDFSDFVIIGGGGKNGTSKEFAVHKIVLSTQSPVLAAVFKSDMKENQTGKMKIDDFSADVVEGMLEFMYTGEVKDSSNAMDLFAIAGKYDIELLKAASEELVLYNVDASNALEVFGLAHLHKSSVLKRAAFNQIKTMFPLHQMNESLMENPKKLKLIVDAARKVQKASKEIREAQAELNLMLQQ